MNIVARHGKIVEVQGAVPIATAQKAEAGMPRWMQERIAEMERGKAAQLLAAQKADPTTAAYWQQRQQEGAATVRTSEPGKLNLKEAMRLYAGLPAQEGVSE